MIEKIDIMDIVLLAKKAGDAIMKIYNQDFKVEYKADNSPLTQADKVANDIVEQGLSKLFKQIPILSEEGKRVSYKERVKWQYFWLVDPLDGTKEFIKKNGEFTVNIALIHKDSPVIGVVYAPALGVCYWAQKGKGAFKDGKRLPLRQKSNNCYKVVVSRSHMSIETQDFIDRIITSQKLELVSIGSSLKICLIAEGEARVYPRMGPTMEWDTAAAHAIVNESGLSLKRYKYRGQPRKFLYNKHNLTNDWFVVS